MRPIRQLWGGQRSFCGQDLVETTGFGLLNLDATEIWSWRILCCGGAAMSIVGYPASPLASTGHQKHPYFPDVTSKAFPEITKHPLGTKFPQLRTAGLENHKQMSHDLETRNFWEGLCL